MEEISQQIYISFIRKFAMNDSKNQSFDRFVTEDLPNIFKQFSPLVIKYNNEYNIITFEAITMNKPVLTETDGTTRELHPKAARLRQQTYESNVYAHMRYLQYQMPDDSIVSPKTIFEKGTLLQDKFFDYVKITSIPVLVGSILCHTVDGMKNYGECPADTASYFIIQGAEKVLMYRERLAFNKIFLFPSKNASTSHTVEYRSEHYNQWRSSQNVVIELSKASKTESASLYIQNIPWVTFMRALGYTRDKDIFTLFRFVARERWNGISGDTNLSAKPSEHLSAKPSEHLSAKPSEHLSIAYKTIFKATLKNNQGIITRQAALAHIGHNIAPSEKSVAVLEEHGLNLIKNKFFPNMGNRDSDNINKAFALCDMACNLIDYSQDSTLKTNKDSYFNKRTESCQDLLGTMTRQCLNTALNTSIKLNILKKRKDGKSINLHEIFADDKVGKGIRDALSSGTWHVNKSKITQTGVSQKNERPNQICTLSQQTKVINQLQKEVKQIAPRLLHPTSWGIVCPADSPEGATCGLVKHFSIMHHVSLGTNGAAITHLLYNQLHVVSLDKLTMKNMHDAVKNNAQYVLVYVNGIPIGVYDDPVSVARFVRECRRKLSISPDTSVSYTHSHVDVRSDRGRNMRPLLVAENLHRLNPNNNVDGLSLEDMEWSSLLAEGIIEYVDKEEEQNLLIAIDLPTYLKKNVGAPTARENETGKVNNQTASGINIPTGQGNNISSIKSNAQINSSNNSASNNLTSNTHNSAVGTPTCSSINGTPMYNNSANNNSANNNCNSAVGTPTCSPINGMQTCSSTLAPTDRYTHMEIHGSVFWGVSASLIPFPDHNQSPRNTYQSAMSKQAHGIFSSVAKSQRMDTSMMEMWYAQRPLVQTKMYEILKCQNFPTGQNVLVAIISSGEYEQEDASQSCKSAIDFGMLRSSIYRTTTISENKQGKSEYSEEFKKVDPSKVSGRKRGDYSNIEEDGIIAVGSNVQNGTIMAQKVIKRKLSPSSLALNKNPHLEYRDTSVSSLNNESGIVDKVAITSTACGIKTVKIRTVKTALTVVGDKFSSRHGQKGVNGQTKPAVDMMFTEDGVIPHFIINSLAFSSRMTWAQWLEAMFATICVINGRFGDATPFSKQYREALYNTLEERKANLQEGHIVDEFNDALRYLGLDPDCEHVMRSGTTGKLYKGLIFMSLTYMQKLKHMVKDKIRARGRGRVQATVRQPVEGRTLGGGIKFGEMERDCLGSHGCAFNIIDRMCISSDPNYIHVCEECNNTIIFVEDDDGGKVWCPVCDRYDTGVVVLLPYSFKLFQQEAIAANMNIKLHVERI